MMSAAAAAVTKPTMILRSGLVPLSIAQENAYISEAIKDIEEASRENLHWSRLYQFQKSGKVVIKPMRFLRHFNVRDSFRHTHCLGLYYNKKLFNLKRKKNRRNTRLSSSKSLSYVYVNVPKILTDKQTSVGAVILHELQHHYNWEIGRLRRDTEDEKVFDEISAMQEEIDFFTMGCERPAATRTYKKHLLETSEL